MWISTVEHSHELDHRATKEYGMPAMVLMERAGLAVFEALKEMLPEGGKIAVICGKGNNGGDGFVLARLALQHGYGVECLVTACEEDLREECRLQMLQAKAQGLRPIFACSERFKRKLECLGHFELLIDAALGIGAEGEVRGNILLAIQAMNRSGVPVLSVDVPSGVHADTGEELGESIWALRTVTFGNPKPYLFQGVGVEHAGYWTVDNIGMPRGLMAEHTEAQLIDKEYCASMLPERLRSSHKGSNGSILIVAGSKSMRGAEALAAKAAIKSGVGLVTVAGVDEVCETVVHHVPEATLLPLPDLDGVVAPEGADIVLQQQSQYHASVFGPGLTHEPAAMEFLERVWKRWEVVSCVDADALNAVSQGLDLPAGPCVMTPHPGEMSRLMQSSIMEVQADRFGTMKRATAKFGKTVLLKGSYSIVGSPMEAMHVNQTGNPGMASAGMGDVLSGVITTLLAQELPPHEAASCGMYWHGMAGDLCGQELGSVGFAASDVVNALPKARTAIISME